MDEEQRSLLIRSSSHYSSSPGLELRYGAHGFVGDASVLMSVAYRLGILAALRSRKSQSVTGVMITACGYNVEKNRVRIVDPDGGALIADWEPFADSVANAVDPDEFVSLIEEFVKKQNISFDGGQPTEILLARDTSPSGESLFEAAKKGISSIAGAVFLDMGVLTTPQLHWLVRARNKGIKASEHDYFLQLSCNYRCLVDLIPKEATADKIGGSLVVDGAYAVGGEKIEALKDLCDGLAIEIRNTSKSGDTINGSVGVDFIQEQKNFPSGFGPSDIGFRCASLDGEAERLLYFFISPSHKGIEIVDGDKMLFLFTLFINEQLNVLQEFENTEEDDHYHACLCILQSPHANGASTNYLKSLGLDVVLIPHGMKSLFAEASKYDIGIYFEADGRGSILFSKKYQSWLEAKNKEFLSSSKGSRKQHAVSRLLAVSRLMNLTVTDALAGLLLVEAILRHNGWSVQKWNELSSDITSRQHNVVELADTMSVALGTTDTVAVSNSGTKEEADSLIDEAGQLDDVSHLSQEFKHIDMNPAGSQIHQFIGHEAQIMEQIDADSSAELKEGHVLGTTTTHVQSYENKNEIHTGLPAKVQDRHESGNIYLHSDETADENKLEARMEVEKSQDGFIKYMQSDKTAMPLISWSKESSGEERKHELDAEQVLSFESHMGISEDTYPSQLLEADPDHVIDKEEIEAERGEADDDAWVLVNDGKGDCLNAGSVMTDTMDYQHLSEIHEPSFEKETCSSPKANGSHVPFGNGDDLLVSADKAEEAGVISDAGPACETLPQSETSSSDRFSSAVVHGDKLQTKAQNASVHVENGSNALVDNMSLDAISSCSEGNNINIPIDSREALPILPNVGTIKDTGIINVVEYASCTIPPSQVNGNVAALPSCDHAVKSEVETLDSQVDIDNGSNCLADDKSSDMRISFSNSEVNGVETPVETLKNLPIPYDVDKTEEVGDMNDAIGINSQPHIHSSISSSLVHEVKLDNEAEHGVLGVENGSDVNLSVDMAEELPNPGVDAPVETLKNLPIPSDVDKTEEVSDMNDAIGINWHPYVHSSISSSLVPEAKLGNEAENGVLDVENGSDVNLPVDMAEELPYPDVEAPVETLKNLPIPSDVDKTEEVGDMNDSIGISSQPHIHISISSSLVHEAKFDNEAQSGVLDVENGSDENLPADMAEELPNPDVVQIETKVADDAARHESEVNGVISGLANVLVSRPEIDSQNNPADVENKSESTVDKVEGIVSPYMNETAETVVGNDFESIPDAQPSSQTNDSSALSALVHHGKLETEAEASQVDAQETGNIIVADSRTPQFQLNSVDADTSHSHDTLLESKAKVVPVNGNKCSNCVVDSVSLNTKISFGSFNCEEFVVKMGPKSEQKVDDSTRKGSRDLPHNDSDSFTPGKTEGDNRGTEAFSEIFDRQDAADNLSKHKVEDVPFTGADKESTSSLEGSAAEIFDGEDAGTEIVKKAFYYLIKVPKYDDEKLNEQIRLAQLQLEEKTRSRDAVLVDYRKKKEVCQELKANQQAAILQERAARDLVRAKRKEIDSSQSLVNVAKDAMTIEDLDSKITSMERTIQHETVPLNEEKKLIREIKQSKQLREQLLAATKKQGVQQALDQKDKNEEHLKVLRKEMDALKERLFRAEQAVNASMESFDCERKILNELYNQYKSSDAVRQDAYLNLQNLKKQWSEKNKYFWSFKDEQRQANSFAAAGDKASLQSLCVNQVETVMKLWNLDDDFRRDYSRCNLQSTLRRLGTLDGRSLGPDEEAPSLVMISGRRINASVKDNKEATPAVVQQKSVAESQKVDTKSNTRTANKVVEQKKQNVVKTRTNNASQIKNELPEALNTVNIEEDKEYLKLRKEEEEMAKKAEELRKEEEAVRLKEVRRLEEKTKALEALERKRRNAEKAQARAEHKARKEAEEKDKEREKRVRKKEKKKGGVGAEDTTSNPENEDVKRPEVQSESTKDPETRERSIISTKKTPKPQYIKQNKLKSIPPPPPPLRNRGRRRMQQWMWVAATIVAIIILFFLGNINFSEITGIFSSLH